MMAVVQDLQASQLLWEELQPHLREVGLLLKTSPTVYGCQQNLNRIIVYIEQIQNSLQLNESPLPNTPNSARDVSRLRSSKSTGPGASDTFKHGVKRPRPPSSDDPPPKKSSPTLLPGRKPLPTSPSPPTRPSSSESTSQAPKPMPPSKTITTSFPNVSVRLTPSRTCADLDAAAQQFAAALRGLEFEERRSNQALTPLSEGDIATLVTFFFHDVFGSQCQRRIYELVDEFAVKDGRKAAPTQLATSIRASERAQDLRLLPEVRKFFSTYSTWQKGEINIQAQLLIRQTIQAYDLYCSWQALRDMAGGSDSNKLRQFLNDQGFPQSVGVDIRTCILRYLSQELGISRTALSNHLQNQSGVYYLVEEFGKGILVLLPKVAAYRIHRLGTNKIQKIVKELSRVLPEAAILCRAAETNILNPLILNGPLPRLLSDQEVIRDNMTLLDALSVDDTGFVSDVLSTRENTPSVDDEMPPKITTNPDIAANISTSPL